MSKMKERMKKMFANRPRKAQLKNGAECLDPKPLHYATGLKRPPTQEERLRRILADHDRQRQQSQEYNDETDFDIDEPDMLTPHEHAGYVFDMIPTSPPPKTKEDAPKASDGSRATGAADAAGDEAAT